MRRAAADAQRIGQRVTLGLAPRTLRRARRRQRAFGRIALHRRRRRARLRQRRARCSASASCAAAATSRLAGPRSAPATASPPSPSDASCSRSLSRVPPRRGRAGRCAAPAQLRRPAARRASPPAAPADPAKRGLGRSRRGLPPRSVRPRSAPPALRHRPAVCVDRGAFFLELARSPRAASSRSASSRALSAGERQVEPVELRQPPHDRVAPRPRRRQLMRQVRALVARLGRLRCAASASAACACSCAACASPIARCNRRDLPRGRFGFLARPSRASDRHRPSGCTSSRASAARIRSLKLPVAFGRLAPAAEAPRRALPGRSSNSSSRVRLASVARNFCSASLRRAWSPAIPAASSSIRRRSVGLAAITAPIRPWLTKAGECAPVAASANSRDTSLARTSRPSIR